MDGTDRRISAEWSAAEAVKGGNSGERETWPATVSKELVMLSLGDGGREFPVPVGSGDNISEVGEVGRLREGGTKNPTLFGSIGDERLPFIRAARRWMTPKSVVPVDSFSSTPPQSSLQPVVNVSHSVAPTVSSLKPATHSIQENPEPREGLVPYPSAIARPTPSTSAGASQMQTSRDSDPTRSGNDDVTKSHGKRKKGTESEDEAQPNELGTRSILMRRQQRPFCLR